MVDLNILESIREMSRWQSKSCTVESGGVLLAAFTSDFPMCYSNCVLRTIPGVHPKEVLDRAQSFFEERKRNHVLWIRGENDKDLEQEAIRRGYIMIAEHPCMTLEKRIDRPSTRANEVRFAENPDAVDDMRKVIREAFTSSKVPSKEVDNLFEIPSRLLVPNLLVGTIYENEEPASAALSIYTHDVGGIYWVGTREKYRKKGYAEACTTALTHRVFDRGVRIATLEANSMGEKLYTKLGYKTQSITKWYLAVKSFKK